MQLESMASMLPENRQVEPASSMDEQDENPPSITPHSIYVTHSGVLISCLVLIFLFLITQDPIQLRLAMVALFAGFFASHTDGKVFHVTKVFVGSVFRDFLSFLNWITGSNLTVETPIFGSIELSKQQQSKRRMSIQQLDRDAHSQVVARYRAPSWSSSRAWQLRCYKADLGWTCQLAAYNVISSKSKQIQYAEQGSLSKLQHMIVRKKASLFDQTEDGCTLLSVS